MNGRKLLQKSNLSDELGGGLPLEGLVWGGACIRTQNLVCFFPFNGGF